jgi:hypothetical protein
VFDAFDFTLQRAAGLLALAANEASVAAGVAKPGRCDQRVADGAVGELDLHGVDSFVDKKQNGPGRYRNPGRFDGEPSERQRHRRNGPASGKAAPDIRTNALSLAGIRQARAVV